MCSINSTQQVLLKTTLNGHVNRSFYLLTYPPRPRPRPDRPRPRPRSRPGRPRPRPAGSRPRPQKSGLDRSRDQDQVSRPTSLVLTIHSNNRCNKTNQSKCKDETTVVVANCDGVTGKQSSIENMLTSLNPDIFLAVKTKLDDSVYNGEFLPSHNFFHLVKIASAGVVEFWWPQGRISFPSLYQSSMRNVSFGGSRSF